MKKKNIVLSLMATGFIFFASCDKPPIFDDPSTSWFKDGCQVAEYHYGLYDMIEPIPMPYLFKKTFDPSGRFVREIDCYFWNLNSPHDITTAKQHHTLLIEKKGQMIYFFNKNINKSNSPDTVARVKINIEGKPLYCISTKELIPQTLLQFNDYSLLTVDFIYRNNKITAIRNTYVGPLTKVTTIDSLRYDGRGNLLSFGRNSYQYDYTRNVTQQFYCMDYMESNWPFYLLQYLGLFPEVTNPKNLRTYLTQENILIGSILTHKFDENGKLISYDFTEDAKIPLNIVWNCQK